MKAGPNTCGQKKVNGASLVITLAGWYIACDAYRNIKIKMTSVEVLQPSRSSQLFSGAKSQQRSFGRMRKQIDNRNLEDTD